MPYYLLQKRWENDFAILNDFLVNDDDFVIEDLQSANPRNTLLKCTMNNHSFVFKQPKYLVGYATWHINIENNFYTFFDELTVNCCFDPKNYVLVLPFLQNFTTDYFEIDVYNLAIAIANKLASFHNALKLSNPKVEKYAKTNVLTQEPLYLHLLNQLKQGYGRNYFLDEVVFPSFTNPQIELYRSILHDFVNSDILRSNLFDFSTEWNSDTLIHGDLKTQNIFKYKNGVEFIDFEFVSIGDKTWDIACIVESFLHDTPIKNHPEKSAIFFKALIDTYCDIQKLDLESKKVVYKKIMKFWAMRIIDKWRTKTLKYISNDVFRKNINRAKLLLTETETYIKLILENAPERYQLFS